MNADMPAEALAIWQEHYANDRTLITTKLQLGHTAYERAVQENNGVLLSGFQTLLREVQRNSDPRLVLPQITDIVKQELSTFQSTQAELNATKKKLTSNGVATEKDLVTALKSNSSLRCVERITERSSINKQGGDLIVTDLAGRTCVVELKAKTVVTVEDLAKFYRDSEAWSGPPSTLFAFVVADGIGSSRKLQEKPLMETTPQGRQLLWFRETAEAFVQQLPMFMALLTATTSSSEQQQRMMDNNNIDTFCKQAVSLLTERAQELPKQIEELEVRKRAADKEIAVLKKKMKTVSDMLAIPLALQKTTAADTGAASQNNPYKKPLSLLAPVKTAATTL